MARIGVVGMFADLYQQARYLEIGVQHGHTFDQVSAARKVAVDPDFKFDVPELKARPHNAGAIFHEVPSDEYFGNIHDPAEKFDVIFIDGLHTFDQTLRDLLNAADCLAPGGIIIVDDVMPPTYAASLTLNENLAYRAAQGIEQVDWMGDVYRLIYFLRDYLRGFSYATVKETHGMAVLWRQPRPLSSQPLDVGKIAHLQYVDAVLGQDAYNLMPQDEIVSRVREHIAAGR